MLSRDWCWVTFPTLAKAQLFYDELGGTIGIDPDVPFVRLSNPIELDSGAAGWACHWWAGTYSEEQQEAIRDQIEILATNSRYGGSVHFGRVQPAAWDPIQDVEE